MTVYDFADVLTPALAQTGGTHTLDDVAEAVAAGSMQFWPGVRSAIVTQLEQTPRLRLCHVFLAGGHLPEILSMIPPIEAWARAQGCTRATLCGRPGWSRSALTTQGWTTPAVYMMKDLGEP